MCRRVAIHFPKTSTPTFSFVYMHSMSPGRLHVDEIMHVRVRLQFSLCLYASAASGPLCSGIDQKKRSADGFPSVEHNAHMHRPFSVLPQTQEAAYQRNKCRYGHGQRNGITSGVNM